MRYPHWRATTAAIIELLPPPPHEEESLLKCTSLPSSLLVLYSLECWEIRSNRYYSNSTTIVLLVLPKLLGYPTRAKQVGWAIGALVGLHTLWCSSSAYITCFLAKKQSTYLFEEPLLLSEPSCSARRLAPDTSGMMTWGVAEWPPLSFFTNFNRLVHSASNMNDSLKTLSSNFIRRPMINQHSWSWDTILGIRINSPKPRKMYCFSFQCKRSR